MTFTSVAHPVTIAFWRSVGHSMNDAFYESFLDEVALAGGHDPFELRMTLLKDKPRHLRLLREVADLAGGWRRGPTRPRAAGGPAASRSPRPSGRRPRRSPRSRSRAARRGCTTSGSPSIRARSSNPAIVKAQVESAAALGTSSVLFEQIVYRDGMRQSRNFDTYPILRREHMPAVHVRIVESGAPMGGVGEPGLPACRRRSSTPSRR